jgi:hypothetical protein
MSKPIDNCLNQVQLLKQCAQNLKSEYAVEKLKSSHAHELTAAAFNYKTKAALDADINSGKLYIQEPEMDGLNGYTSCVGDRNAALSRIDAQIQKLDTPVKPNDVLESIEESFGAECYTNDCTNRDSTSIMMEGGDYDFLCSECTNNLPSDFNLGECRYCGETAKLNSYGECSEHYGESMPESEEHAEGWQHTIERAAEEPNL